MTGGLPERAVPDGAERGAAVASPAVPRPRLSFRVALGLVAVGGFLLRAVFTLATTGDDPATGDGVYFSGQADALAHGLGFIDPILNQAFDLRLQAAHHPPLYVVYLALAQKVVGDSPELLRLATSLAGLAMIVVVGLVGRRIAGERAGLIAAVVAALYPNLWANDPLLLSEPLYGLMIALVLLCAYRLWDDPRPREAAVLGLVLGLATLTRAEALLLFVILALPLVLLCRQLDKVARAVLVAVVFATGAFVMAPWVGHNLYRFNQPVTLSYGLAGVLTQANCDRTYEGEYLGYWHPDCSFLDETLGPSAQQCLRTPARCAEIYGARFGDESDAAKLGQQEGLDYISAHRGRVPVVVAARVGRIWGLFRPGQQVRIDAVGEGRPLWVSRLALITFYELVAVGAVGLWLLRKRKVPILPLVSMAVLVTAVAAIAIPVTRYRVPVEVALAVLAGVVGEQCLTWWRARRHAGARPGVGDGAGATTDPADPVEPARA